MAFKEIEFLIEKYFSGKSSQQEEARLKSYFSSDLVHDALLEYQPLFQYLDKEGERQLDTSFDERLVQKLEQVEIDNQLEKYFAGESSINEEKHLKKYFNSDQVSNKHKAYQPLFQLIKSEASHQLDASFDKRLIQQIEIDSQLEKYFAGESSIDEETQLREYFNSDQVNNKHKVYQPLFQYFVSEASHQLDASFDESLIKKLGAEKEQNFRVRRLYPTLMRAAAMIAFAIGVFFTFQQLDNGNGNELAESYIKDKGTIELEEDITPEEAYQEVMAALALVSSKLNKGEQKALEGIGKIDKATKALRQ